MKRMVSAMLAAGILAGVSSAALAADVIPPEAYATNGWYLRGDAGWSWLGGDLGDDSGFALGGGIGYQYNEFLRADVRADWAGTYDTGPADMDVTTLLGNMYFDIPTDTMLTPYLGAGAGYGWAPRDGASDKDGFAFALMAGAELSLSDNLSADVGYRYRQILSDGNDPMEHQVLLGLRYKF